MGPNRSPYPPIGDYAIIGNCRTSALVSRDGSVDWLCLPRFDGPSVFAALLDQNNGGKFYVRPTEKYGVQREYIRNTNVLKTTFTTASGQIELTDLMPVSDATDDLRQLEPEHELLRRVRCIRGAATIQIGCFPRPDYARATPRILNRGDFGFFWAHQGHAFLLRSQLSLDLTDDETGVFADHHLSAGEEGFISLSYGFNEPLVAGLLGHDAERSTEATIGHWRDWAAQCRYSGPYREIVVRSALVLKLMSFAPSGAVVAAPTTSLPERIGGSLNWDYRYCWLRDASLTMRALIDLGFAREGNAFLWWLLHATRLTWPHLHVAYSVYGNVMGVERELSNLEGYAKSRPVRLGNAARDQLQTDIYGELIEAVCTFVRRGGNPDDQTLQDLVSLGNAVCDLWREPDAGIWEPRGEREHHTHSKVMCWVALDRLIWLHEKGHISAPIDRFRRERDEIRLEIDTKGYNDVLNSYVATLGGEELDAALLMMIIHRYDDPSSPKLRQTFNRICDSLGLNGLLYRYRKDGPNGDPLESPFGICSFWAVEAQALQGDVEGATRRFEQLLEYANDVGLYAEEIDPDTGAAIGNFPQAFTHVGLISAALSLEACAQATDSERSSGSHNKSESGP